MTESESGKLKDLCGKIAQTIPGGDARDALELLGKFVDTQYNEIKKLQARVNKLEDNARGAADNASP